MAGHHITIVNGLEGSGEDLFCIKTGLTKDIDTWHHSTTVIGPRVVMSVTSAERMSISSIFARNNRDGDPTPYLFV